MKAIENFGGKAIKEILGFINENFDKNYCAK